MGVFRLMFGKYLLVTNTVSCGLMMAAGDVMQQRSDFLKKHMQQVRNNNTESSIASKSITPAIEKMQAIQRVYAQENEDDEIVTIVSKNKDKNSIAEDDDFDYVRTRNMTTVGLLQGPFHHFFYAILEKKLPGKDTVAIFKKTFLDQTIASPTCLGIFFFGLGVMESKNLSDINGEVKLKLFDTWKVDCMFWPPTQFINFLFVPIRYRVIYINFMTMIYDIFLSYMKYVSIKTSKGYFT
ncbi:hypothetical protein QAD02_023427 [Eretmocerus hayati]|uniref:Uncharacterized protein n=1 Tax=Eretmocerus hayati TaxID=131215 RepID=A0ACC2PWY1_9HYME|nr:hypothetical protein QAD02_023427 [Eretmocerus hayati]